MSRSIKDELYLRANKLAAQINTIIEEDKIDIIFCSISEYESVLADCGSEDDFFHVLQNCNAEKYKYWMIENVQRDIGLASSERREYPFNIQDINDNWIKMNEYANLNAALGRMAD